MIKRITLKDISIEEFERKFSGEGNGKILSISVELEKDVHISVITNLNEEVLSVEESGVYYPRSNISSEKNRKDTLTGEVQTLDYHYFDGLLIEITSETDRQGEIALKELVILYDDMQ